MILPRFIASGIQPRQNMPGVACFLARCMHRRPIGRLVEGNQKRSLAANRRGAFQRATVSSRDLNIAGIFLTARDVGVTRAMDSLERLAIGDSSFWSDGHMIAHGLGRFAIANNRHDPLVLSQCRPTFQAGCYHGVLEGYLASLPRVDAGAASRLCTALGIDRGPAPTKRLNAPTDWVTGFSRRCDMI